MTWFDPATPVRTPRPRSCPRTLHLAATRTQSLRYGENPHQVGARYSLPGGSWWDDAVQHGGKEMSYLNVYDADAAWRLVHSLGELPDGRRHQARQPVRRGGRRRHHDGLRPGARVRPDLGLRRHRRRQPGGAARAWPRRSRRSSPRSSSPPATRPTPSSCCREEEPAGPRPPRRPWCRPSTSVRSRAASSCRPPTGRRWTAASGRSPRTAPRPRTSGATSSWPGGSRRGHVERHRAGQGRAGRRHRCRPAEPSRRRADRRREGRRPGRGRGLRVGRVLPVPRRPRRRGRGRRHRGHPARRLDPRRRGHRRRQRAGLAMVFTGERHFQH